MKTTGLAMHFLVESLFFNIINVSYTAHATKKNVFSGKNSNKQKTKAKQQQQTNVILMSRIDFSLLRFTLIAWSFHYLIMNLF